MVCVIGAGHLGSALVRQLAASGIAVRVVDRNAHKAEALAQLNGVEIAISPEAGDVVILCVKPAGIEDAAASIAHLSPKLVISVAAGVRLRKIENKLPSVPVVRAMPNIASALGFGATGICGGTHASDTDLDEASQLLGVLGIVDRVDERQIDAVTGLSGSGPAYVFKVCEAMIAGGVAAGLEKDVATRLAIATVNGAAQLLMQEDADPTMLRESVTTPNGTTAAALAVLDDRQLSQAFVDAIAAAKLRCEQLASE